MKGNILHPVDLYGVTINVRQRLNPRGWCSHIPLLINYPQQHRKQTKIFLIWIIWHLMARKCPLKKRNFASHCAHILEIDAVPLNLAELYQSAYA